MVAPRGPVLIVDDDPSIRDGLRLLIETRGYPTVTARNGAEALGVLEPFEQHRLLTSRGAEVLEQLRSADEPPEVNPRRTW